MASSREGLPRQEQSIRGRARVKAWGEEVRMRVAFRTLGEHKEALEESIRLANLILEASAKVKGRSGTGHERKTTYKEVVAMHFLEQLVG